MKNKTFLWLIPFALSVLIGLLNPCGGIVSVISVLLSMPVLVSMEKSIFKDAKCVQEIYQTDKVVALELFTNNWMMTAFTFVMVNVVMNIVLFYSCYLSITSNSTMPIIGIINPPILNGNLGLICILFVGSLLFHIVGTVMIFVEGNRIKDQYVPA